MRACKGRRDVVMQPLHDALSTPSRGDPQLHSRSALGPRHLGDFGQDGVRHALLRVKRPTLASLRSSIAAAGRLPMRPRPLLKIGSEARLHGCRQHASAGAMKGKRE